MRSSRLIPLLALVLMLLVSCASTPKGKYSQSNDIYIGVTKQLIVLREDGVIGDEDWREDILPGINEGNRQLRAWRLAIDEGQDPVSREKLFQSTLESLMGWLKAYSD